MARRPLHRPLNHHLAEQVSTRGMPQVVGQPVNAPGVPGSLTYPDGTVFTPVEANAIKALQGSPAFAALAPMVPALQTLIAAAIQRAFDQFSVYTQIKPFENMEVIPVPLPLNTVVSIDPPNTQSGRRVLFLINTDTAANAIWFNKTASVAAFNGIPIAPNYGSYMVTMTEYARHWAICPGLANTLIAVWYS